MLNIFKVIIKKKWVFYFIVIREIRIRVWFVYRMDKMKMFIVLSVDEYEEIGVFLLLLGMLNGIVFLGEF